MATLTYTAATPFSCAGGGHIRFDVSFNGGQSRRVVYATDAVREPLSSLTEDERETLALLILKVHMAGKTRAQIATELQSGPVSIAI